MKSSQIINILLFIGAAQGLLLSITLLSIKRKKKVPNILLAAFILIFSIIIFFHSLDEFQGGHREIPERAHSVQVLFFLFGPLIYSYVNYVTDRSFRLVPKYALHLVPFIILISIISIAELLNISGNIWYFLNISLTVFITIHYSTYLLFSIKTLEKYKIYIRDSFSSIGKINLDWLQFILITQVIIWPIALIVEIIFHNQHSWDYIWLLVSISIYMMGYKGMMQPEVLRDEPFESNHKPSQKKYERSTLNPDTAEDYFKRLINIMDKEKLYLNPDLTLQCLAGKLNISIHHLSQVINEKFQRNFFEFVNCYRVEEAKKLLVDPDKKVLNISAIAFESGFNTLSSFNSAFKKFTHKTPSQFRTIS